ncbi:MAG: dihydropteroate synthase [Paramuribaculum sp.]|nr:dihydropteroate synthase [Paramuribaculum sp.]
MGIINVTPDSFYAGSRKSGAQIGVTAIEMLTHGAEMLDLGAYSSRPGADDVTPREEMARLRSAMKEIRAAAPEAIVSVDTFRADVAKMSIEELGADIINDISGGLLDKNMIATVAELKVPYILMHMRGTPATMQQMCDYPHGVTAGVIKELSERIDAAAGAGICDIIVDPGFGFAKTVEQNYQLLCDLPLLGKAFGRPILIGISRKSMLTKPLGITPADALPATVAVNAISLEKGASIIRVHDVEAARQCVEVFNITHTYIQK